MKKSVFFFFVAIAMVACDNNPTPETNCVEPAILNIDGQEIETSVFVNYDGEWMVSFSDAHDWIYVEPLTGNEPGNVKVKVKANVSHDKRSIVMEIDDFSTSKKVGWVEINQESAYANGIGVDKKEIQADPDGGTYLVNVYADCKWEVKKSVNWVSVDPSVGRNDGMIRIEVLKSDAYLPTEAILTICEYGGDPDKKVEVKIVRGAKAAPVFSVSDSKKVILASGNLQYHPANNEWRIGEPLDVRAEDNRNISPDYNGWIDLFGWGTSGKIEGLPVTQWSNDVLLYSPNGENLSGDFDWGSNNLKDERYGVEGPWRTLTQDEWEYLIDRHLVGFAYYQYTYFMYIYPSKYFFTDGSTSILNNIKPCPEYTTDQWENLMREGCAIIPLGGYRVEKDAIMSFTSSGGKTIYVGSYWTSTCYWSISQSSETNKYAGEVVYLCTDDLDKCQVMTTAMMFNAGNSVRLAMDVE